ncbi:ExbD/TolR family protein [Halopseudomonas sp.]|jgi:biopolymer transport protein ExbD|uniref:ExbD/TolR family protein n=1 Tax=Halopseudomonas sp. TaxID=2901191 RepID=UPI003001F8D9|nr:biopolymer transporter ExbD [Halopseudomonas aestusnigri]|tara:strand:+ start:797 stop:1225 length:429 start_codon:yes stop_codon:yes gene_type:complete
MKLVAENSTRKDKGDDQLIPLINIVFLMLIFFMVAGQISQSDATFVSPPESIAEAPIDDDALQILIDAELTIWLNDQQITLEELEAPLITAFEQVEDPESFTLAVKADGEVPVENLQALLQRIKASGFRRVTLLTQPGEALP